MFDPSFTERIAEAVTERVEAAYPSPALRRRWGWCGCRSSAPCRHAPWSRRSGRSGEASARSSLTALVGGGFDGRVSLLRGFTDDLRAICAGFRLAPQGNLKIVSDDSSLPDGLGFVGRPQRPPQVSPPNPRLQRSQNPHPKIEDPSPDHQARVSAPRILP